MADPILLTPGPLTTSEATKSAMLHDWGSWDVAFNKLTSSVCQDIVNIVSGAETHVCVPLQGSGTFAVEAALGTLVPRNGKVLVPNNGAYCQRILRILAYLRRDAIELNLREDEAADPARIERMLMEDPSISHVALVHCETGTGILNPLSEIASVVAHQRRGLIVDAMSSFGAIQIDARTMPFDAVIAASGKCLEGVPGMGFVIARRTVIEGAAGNCHSLALDLYDQWLYMQKTGQWRFTPPTHVVAALRRALDQYLEEGGQCERLRRYSENCRELVEGIRAIGLKTFLHDDIQAPIIVTVHAPATARYQFADLYARVREQGFILYPGKLTKTETFRVGCIGAIDKYVVRQAVGAIANALSAMNTPFAEPSPLET